jgi:hypothetical protein
MTTPDPATFGDLRGSLPEHSAEVLTGHEGRPTAADQRHKRPAEDLGATEEQKYGGGQ